MRDLIEPRNRKKQGGIESQDPRQAQSVPGERWVKVPGGVEETGEEDEGEEEGCPERVGSQTPV